jgi:NADH-ubiquinone oxidoreductase chain 5
MITFISNRLGDLGVIVCIAWIFDFGGFNLFSCQHLFHINFSYVSLAIILAAITKRAQIPFSAWLPAAMAAPTPVSSLVHSSTLVTAGVYLLIRFSFLIKLNYYLLLFSLLTITISGLSALFETDIKKVIALSTLSQLGVIIFSLAVGLKELAFFHLITHALFKSLLFLCAGFYIHSRVDWQDIRSVSKIYHAYPLLRLYFVVASLALSGAPFLTGFYSKDAIIELFSSQRPNIFV